jgi:glycosyltransferase involved in cell wall biosynthesis
MKFKRIKILAFSLNRGGAAKAAFRFFSIATQVPSINVEVLTVEESPRNYCRAWHFLKRAISLALVIRYQTKCRVKCSANFFSYRPALQFLSNDDAVINIHWINNDTISIFDLKKIPYGSIITIHDEWFYCGIEHYFSVTKDFKESAYHAANEIGSIKFDSAIHRFVWGRKRKAFFGRKDLLVTCPSKWLADRAKASHVFHDCDVRVLYNSIDTSLFQPMNKVCTNRQRREMCLGDRMLVVFGAIGGTSNKLKGFSELEDALKLLANNPALKDKIMLGLFGGDKRDLNELHGFSVHQFGFIENGKRMAEVYSLAHVTIVPSKVEAFGQVAAESQSCGTPVIAFDTSGLRDIVIDGRTGFLADPFSPISLAEKIEQLLCLSFDQYDQLCSDARNHVIQNFSHNVIAQQYEKIFNEQLIKKKETC